MKLEGYSGAMCNKHVHSKTTCPDFIAFYAAWYRDLCVGHTLLNRPIEMCGPRKRVWAGIDQNQCGDGWRLV